MKDIVMKLGLKVWKCARHLSLTNHPASRTRLLAKVLEHCNTGLARNQILPRARTNLVKYKAS